MIYITGDTHIPVDIEKLNTKNFPQQKDLTKDDYVIVCGDFGLLWEREWSKEELYWKKWLEEKPWTTLFVDGNHENFDRLNSYPVEIWNGGKIHRISDSIIHLMRGQMFDIDGNKIFTFGGAQSIDRGYMTGTSEIDEGVIWWTEELPELTEMDEGRENLSKNDWKVDFVITHDLPQKELVGLGLKFHCYLDSCYLNGYLEDLRVQLSYKHWYSGHHHVNITLSPKQTVIYNDIVKIGDYVDGN